MAAFVMRLTRSSLLEVLRRDYVRMLPAAKAWRNAGSSSSTRFRNAPDPCHDRPRDLCADDALVVHITVELVFSRPGLGTLLIGGVTARDYTLVQAGLVVFAFFVVGVNLVTDLICAAIDPRVALR